MDKINRLLSKRDWILADGATGSSLMERGLESGYPPELWNLEKPGIIRDHYRSFIDSGCDIVLTNSFGGTEFRMDFHKAAKHAFSANKAAASLLVNEIARAGRDVIAAGSVGPISDFDNLLTYDQKVEHFGNQISALKEGGIDVVWIETMFGLDEMHASLEAAKNNGMKAVCTMSFNQNGRTLMGDKPSQFAAAVRNSSHAPIAYGANCGNGLQDFLASMIEMNTQVRPGDIVIAKANCGVPKLVGDVTEYEGTPEIMGLYARFARDLGARIIGGCCGTKPEHLRAMKNALDGYKPQEKIKLEDVELHVGVVQASVKRALFAAEETTGRTRGTRRISSKHITCDCG